MRWHERHTRGETIAVCFIVLSVAGSAPADEVKGFGLASSALPGLHRIGHPIYQKPTIAVLAESMFGVFDSMGTQAGPHQRVGGTLSLAATPVPYLAAALKLHGFGDFHPNDADGADRSGVVDPYLTLRGVWSPAHHVNLGIDLQLWVPGRNGRGFIYDAATLDTRAMIAATVLDEKLLIAAHLGFRLDNSAAAEPNLPDLRPGDRVSLGLSDYHAVLTAVGGAYRIAKTAFFAELFAAWLVGSNAPVPANDPFGVTVGVRYFLSNALAVSLTTETFLGTRPALLQGDPLIPLLPRFSVFVGVSHGWAFSRSIHGRRVIMPPPKSPSPPAAASPPAPRPSPPKGRVEGTLIDAEGNRLNGATVTLTVGDFSATATSNDDGAFRFEGVPTGDGTITAAANRYETHQWPISVTRSTVLGPTLLKPVLPPSQLRGMVRTFSGKGLSAEVSISPSGRRLETDETGAFVADLAPGRYEVTVESSGYETQTQVTDIETNGVSILNFELRSLKKPAGKE